MTGWPAFTEGLAATLADLGERGVFIVARPSGSAPALDADGYVQFQHLGHTIIGEAASNEFLADDLALGAAAQLRLVQADWHPPEPGKPNWWFELPWPAPMVGYRRLAGMAATALREAYGVSEPDDLAYRAWTDPGKDLTLPLLGLDAE